MSSDLPTILRLTLVTTVAYLAFFSTLLFGTTPGLDVVIAGVGILVPLLASMARLARGESARALGWAAGLAAILALGLVYYLLMPRMGVPKLVLMLSLYPLRTTLALGLLVSSAWLWRNASRSGMTLDRKEYWIGVAMSVFFTIAWAVGVALFAARPTLS
jgi:hypothetical protein